MLPSTVTELDTSAADSCTKQSMNSMYDVDSLFILLSHQSAANRKYDKQLNPILN